MNFLPGLMKTFSTDNIAAIGSSRSSQSRETVAFITHMSDGEERKFYHRQTQSGHMALLNGKKSS